MPLRRAGRDLPALLRELPSAPWGQGSWRLGLGASRLLQGVVQTR